MLTVVLCLVLVLSTLVFTEIATVFPNSMGRGYRCVLGTLDPDHGIAWATFSDTRETLGWATLVVNTSSSEAIPNDVKSYAAGFVEGCLTHSLISSHLVNVKSWLLQEYNDTMPSWMSNFLDENWRWLESQVASFSASPYWHAVGVVMQQLMGLVDSFELYSHHNVTFAEFQLMAAEGDCEDLKYLVPEKRNSKRGPQMTHCSAGIALKSDLSDLFFGHNTWGHYVTMTRIFKEYWLNFASPLFPISMSLSSYPATLVSQDDFFLVSGKQTELYVQETTLEIKHLNLFSLLTPKSCLSWLRTLVANLLSKTGSEWVQTFAKYNSGTYNNMWSVLDLLLFEPKLRLKEGLLTVLEQTPGKTIQYDATRILGLGHWPSINAPYTDAMYFRAGYDTMQPGTDDYLLHGSQVSVRSQIFRRDIGSASQSLETFKSFLRQCRPEEIFGFDPGYVMAPRFDLRKPGKNSGCTGTIDAKVTSWSQWLGSNRRGIELIAGPAFEKPQVPPFRWSSSDACRDSHHEGMIDEYMFDWVTYRRSDVALE